MKTLKPMAILSFFVLMLTLLPVSAAQGAPKDPLEVNISFEIFEGGSWKTIGHAEFGRSLETKTLTLPQSLSGDFNIRVSVPAGTYGAFLDYVAAEGAALLNVNGDTGYACKKLTTEDLDILPVENGLILHFSGTRKDTGTGTLTVCARGEAILPPGSPYLLPFENPVEQPITADSHFLSYTLGQNSGSFAIATPKSNGFAPFVHEYLTPFSGHPHAYSDIFVMDDGQFLYIYADSMNDNTFDHGKDFTKVYVKDGDSVKVFELYSDNQGTPYGHAAFAYTDSVAYEHMIYSFKIPFSELPNGPMLEMAFSLYGTSSQFSLNFNSNGGSSVTPLYNLDVNDLLTEPNPPPTKIEANFAGWFVDAALTDEWDFGIDKVGIKPGVNWLLPSFTLYAKWTHTLTVNNGAGSGDYAENEVVSITANPAPSGKVFDKWTGGNSGVFSDPNSSSTSFTMPTSHAAVTATYKNDAGNSGQQSQYPVIRHPGTFSGSGDYAGVIDGPFNKFVRVLLNGNVVAPGNYTATEGSTVITLKESFLQTLSNGTYVFRVEFTDNYANLNLVVDGVSGDPDSDVTGVPQTGDTSHMLAWIIILLFSMLGILCTLIWFKWQQHRGT